MKTFLRTRIPSPIWEFGKKIINIFRTNRYTKISGEYSIIENPDRAELKKEWSDTWKDDSIPVQQQKITKKQLPNFAEVKHMKVLVDLVKETGIPEPTLLEIGCSTGYFSEIFEKSGLRVKYSGCDYSPQFINVAQETYPSLPFQVCDTTSLPYSDSMFDIIVSGCCILHVVEYEEAIKESARTAKEYVIFQRTPVLHERKTTFTKKIGYGLPMMEIFFNEEELTQLFAKNGLAVQRITTISNMKIKDIEEPVFLKSYLCKKIHA